MKKVETTTTYTCDLCGKPMERKFNKFKVIHSYAQEWNNYITFQFSAEIPYGPTNPDVCKDCVIKALKGDYLYFSGPED